MHHGFQPPKQYKTPELDLCDGSQAEGQMHELRMENDCKIYSAL